MTDDTLVFVIIVNIFLLIQLADIVIVRKCLVISLETEFGVSSSLPLSSILRMRIGIPLSFQYFYDHLSASLEIKCYILSTSKPVACESLQLFSSENGQIKSRAKS